MVPPKALERFEEEAGDEMGLEPPGFGTLHVLADRPDPGHVHRVVGQGAAFDQLPKVLAVEGLVDDLEEAASDLGAVAVADRVQQQFAQRPVLERQLRPARRTPGRPSASRSSFELLEQAVVDLAFAGVLGDEVPEVADLGLADAVDPAEALFQAVRVPGQVVVDHQVGALEVDALRRRRRWRPGSRPPCRA